MSVELYIEDERVDLQGNEVIATDYAFYDIAKLESRNGSLSISFRLQKTQRNRQIMEVAEQVTNQTQLPYKRLKARVFDIGVDMGIRFAELRNSNSYYNVRLYGNNADFFSLIAGKKLGDLDLGDLNHFLKRPLVATSRQNNDGYIYPLINYYDNAPNANISNSNRHISVDGMLPALFYETVLQRLCADVGYTLTNDITYKDGEVPIIPFSARPQRSFKGKRYEGTLEAGSSGGNPSLKLYIPMTSIISQAESYYTANNIDTAGLFTIYPDEFTATLKYSFLLDNLGVSPQNATFYFNYTTADGVFTEVTLGTINVPVGAGTATFAGQIERSLLFNNGYAGWYFSILSATNVATALSGSTIEVANVRIDTPTDFEYNPSEADTRDYITTESIADITLTNLLKDYLNMFCGVIDADNNAKKVRITPFQNILSNKTKAIDWSDKVDYSDEPDVSYIFDSYAQRNTYTYADDDAVVKPFGTDGIIQVNNANLEAEKKAVELKFAATQSSVLLMDIEVPNIALYTLQGGNVTITGKAKPRVLMLKRFDATDFPNTSNLRYTDGGNTDVSDDFPLCWFISDIQQGSLGFERNLLPTYYGGLQGIVSNVKIVKQLLRLTAVDINQLDFFTPIYLDNHSAIFYISKIQAFRYGSGKSVLATLIKI
jgi:hypothetical protein